MSRARCKVGGSGRAGVRWTGSLQGRALKAGGCDGQGWEVACGVGVAQLRYRTG